MKTLNTFLEGLLSKSNKKEFINLRDVDINDADELISFFPKCTPIKHGAPVRPEDGLCIIVSGIHAGNNTHISEFNLYTNVNGKLYQFRVAFGKFNRETKSYEPHKIYSEIIEGIKTEYFYYGKCLWKVDIEDAKDFLTGMLKLHNKVIDVSCDCKVFEKWLGVKLDVVG
jgi:hypothetical protein